MALPATLPPPPDPADQARVSAIGEIYRACHLREPVVLLARDVVHMARLAKVMARDGNPGPYFRLPALVVMIAALAMCFTKGRVADFGADMAGYMAVAVVPIFALADHLGRLGSTSCIVCGPLFRMAAALLIGITVGLLCRGSGIGLMAAEIASGLTAVVFLIHDLTDRPRLRERIFRSALSRPKRGSTSRAILGASSIGRLLEDRLQSALTDAAGTVVANRHGPAPANEIERTAFWDAVRSEWRRLDVPNDAAPVLGNGVGFSFGVAARIGLLAGSDVDPFSLPRLLQSAIRLHPVSAAACLLDRVAIVLPTGAPVNLSPVPAGQSRWRRSRWAPWNQALHWLDEPYPTSMLVDLAPFDWLADRILASQLRRLPGPEQRTPALEALGMARVAAALRLKPVHWDSYGRLYVLGRRAAPSVFVAVKDKVVDSDGTAIEHWISVPPHVATAHEAVAWTFRMSEKDYKPSGEA